MNPLLSIVIPTKNRYSTLFPVVETLLNNIIGDSYEIIIQDNSDDNSIAIENLKIINDCKVKYFHCNNYLSVTENSNLAISKAKGKYVTFIGDDDLVSPFILEVVNIMEKEKIQSLNYPKGNYYWPNLTFTKKYGFNQPASLQIPKPLSLICKKKSVEKELNKVFSSGGIYIYDLPCLYHGVTRKDILEKVKQKFRTYVPGASPDMAIAMALASILQEFHRIDYPVTITGASTKSAAGLGVKDAHIAKIEDVSWLPKQIVKNWDKNVPAIWTGPTIYAQTIHEVLTFCKIKNRINYSKLYAHIYLYNRSIRKDIIPYIKNNSKDFSHLQLVKLKLRSAAKLVIWNSPSLILNILIRLRGDYKKKSHIENISNVNQCMQYLLENTNPKKL